MTWPLPSFDVAELLQWNALILFGGLLLLGLVGGHLVSQNRWIPRITGYLLVGFLLGEGGLNWLSGDLLRLASLFGDIALALVIYQLGRYVDIRWLLYERYLLATVLTSALLCFVCVSWALQWAGVERELAVMCGVLAIGTAPAVVMVVVREMGAEGNLTRRLAAMTALNNLVALLAAYLILPVVAVEGAVESASAGQRLASGALYSLLGSLLLAYITYRLMMPLARLLGRERTRQFVLVIAIVTLAIGVAHMLGLPVLLTMLAFAILSKNLDQQYDLMELEFGVASELFIVLLFVAVGASIHPADFAAAGMATVVFILARSGAMAVAIFSFARFARLRWQQAGLLTLGTLPLAQASIGLTQVAILYPQTASRLAALLAGSLIILELVGPIATQVALLRSGEASPMPAPGSEL